MEVVTEKASQARASSRANEHQRHAAFGRCVDRLQERGMHDVAEMLQQWHLGRRLLVAEVGADEDERHAGGKGLASGNQGF